jgi:hypothetical protein
LHIPAFISLVRSIGLAGIIACVALGLPGFAAEPIPDATAKKKIASSSISIDDKIHARPALAADCFAEGKKGMEEKGVEAFASPPPAGENPWTFERKYTVRSVVADHYVSVIRSDYSNTGGPHPNSDVNTILWDSAADKRISIRPFFTETADNGPTLKAMRQGVIASLEAEKKKRGAEGTDASAIAAIEPKLLKIGPVSLAPSTEEGTSSGLTFHYSPYAVGSYAEGEYVAFVPWETLKPYLSPEGARIFGGARPKGDEDR